MRKIHPKERYSKSATRNVVDLEMAKRTAQQMGWPTQGLKLELLSGGFMNANVLLESTSAKAVLRISAHDADLARKELAVAEHAIAAGV